MHERAPRLKAPFGPVKKEPAKKTTEKTSEATPRPWSREDEMKAGIPGLYDKLQNVTLDKAPELSLKEREFLTALIMNNLPVAMELLTSTAQKIWGAKNVEWSEPGLPGKRSRHAQEKISSAFLFHFYPANSRVVPAQDMLDFYLGTTLFQAEKKMTTWPDWQERTFVRLK